MAMLVRFLAEILEEKKANLHLLLLSGLSVRILAAGCGERLGIMSSYDEPALKAAGATQVFKDTVAAIEWATAKAAAGV